MDFKKILVGIDGSENSKRAALAAADLAELFKGSVTLVSVVRPGEYSLAVEDKAFIENLKEFHDDLVEAVKEDIERSGIKVDTKIELGTPWKELTRLAREGHYDLIVVGSRGVGQVAEFLIGSNSTRVVQHTEIPVLVVP
ncbi:MAG: universal stress protein [Methanomassiliicoccales archaeon]|jgi:nucleotide-binding universal stress UspA family protein